MAVKKEIASPLFRCFACLGDLAFSYTIFSYLCSFDRFNKIYMAITKGILGRGADSLISGGFTSYLPGIICVYVIYILFRFYSTLIFGVSLSQKLVGMSGFGTEFWKRAGGGARVLFEGVLSPLIIFDVPILFKKRTMKEVLTFTAVTCDGGPVVVVRAVLIAFTLVVIGLFSPLMQNLTLLDGIKVSFKEQNKEKLSNETNFKKFKNINSNYFKFSSFTSLKDERFVLLPSFEVTKEGSKKRIRPFFTVYDRRSKGRGLFKIDEKFYLLDLLRLAKKGNPFFFARYPEINKILQMKKRSFSKRRFKAGVGPTSLFSDKAKHEIKSLIQSSFELSATGVIWHILANGPFIRGHILIRNALLAKAKRGVVPEVDIIRVGNHNFLRFVQVEIDETLSKSSELLIPIESANAISFYFEFEEYKGKIESRREFRETFFGPAEWYFDYYKVFTLPDRSLEMTPLSILDGYTISGLASVKRRALEEYIYHYYFDLCKEAISRDDGKLIDILINSLNRYYLVAKLKNRSVPEYFSYEFLGHLRVLKSSIAGRDKRFFGN